MKNKLTTSILAIILVLVTVFGISACSKSDKKTDTNTENSVEMTIDEYKIKVKTSEENLLANYETIKRMANFEYNTMNAYDRISSTPYSNFDNLLAEAYDYCETDSQTLQTEYEKVCNEYKEITLIKIDNEEATQIKELYNSMFDAYMQLYNLATNPTGTTDSFANEAKEYMDTVDYNKGGLKVWLE
ncbi:MAG: hypothetical protein K2H13_10155 [Eubacterium sp.]|nr:hypothetical protein [Eubacterium sp.]MDE6155469.1 hypothetical protein [Eubacterium sp.]